MVKGIGFDVLKNRCLNGFNLCLMNISYFPDAVSICLLSFTGRQDEILIIKTYRSFFSPYCRGFHSYSCKLCMVIAVTLLIASAVRQ